MTHKPHTSLASGRPTKFKQDPNLKYMVFALYDPADLSAVKFVGVTALSRSRDAERDRGQALRAYINRLINSARCKTSRSHETDFGKWLRELGDAPAYSIVSDGLPRRQAAQLRTQVVYKHHTTCLNVNVPRQMPTEVPYVAD